MAERTVPPVNFVPQRDQLFDKLGRSVSVGDGVVLPTKLDTVWRISKLAPVLRPDLPPGMLEVTLVAAYSTTVPGGVPIPDLIKVLDVRDAKTEPAPEPPPNVLVTP